MLFGFGKPNVEKMKDKGDVEGLIRALEYKMDTHVRINAADALGEIGDSKAVAPLICALGDSEGQVRSQKLVLNSVLS